MKTNKRLNNNLPSALGEYDLESRFDDHLDGTVEHIEALGVTVAPSDFLRTHDEVAYRCAFNDWLDGECRSDGIVEYDGSHYDKDDFDSAVDDTIYEVETDRDQVREELTGLYEKLAEVNDEDKETRNTLEDKVSELDSEESGLDAELSELEDLK